MSYEVIYTRETSITMVRRVPTNSMTVMLKRIKVPRKIKPL